MWGRKAAENGELEITPLLWDPQRSHSHPSEQIAAVFGVKDAHNISDTFLVGAGTHFLQVPCRRTEYLPEGFSHSVLLYVVCFPLVAEPNPNPQRIWELRDQNIFLCHAGLSLSWQTPKKFQKQLGKWIKWEKLREHPPPSATHLMQTNDGYRGWKGSLDPFYKQNVSSSWNSSPSLMLPHPKIAPLAGPACGSAPPTALGQWTWERQGLFSRMVNVYKTGCHEIPQKRPETEISLLGAARLQFPWYHLTKHVGTSPLVRAVLFPPYPSVLCSQVFVDTSSSAMCLSWRVNPSLKSLLNQGHRRNSNGVESREGGVHGRVQSRSSALPTPCQQLPNRHLKSDAFSSGYCCKPLCTLQGNSPWEVSLSSIEWYQ